MNVLMVEPGKVPYAVDIGEGLEALQAAVGGDIQAVYPYDDPVALICNEEGKYMGLPLNRALRDDEGNIYDIVAGNFFLCGLGEEDFTDLPADLMEKYRQQFEHPEQFVRIAGKILAVKQPVPSEEQEAQRAQMATQEAQREEMRLDDSTDLAFDLDVFLRQHSDAYADIRSFEWIAKKHEVRYHIEKDPGTDPPKWTVYFKANQADALTAAFKEYTRKDLARSTRPSLLSQLAKFKELAQALSRDKVKNKEHGGPER